MPAPRLSRGSWERGDGGLVIAQQREDKKITRDRPIKVLLPGQH